MSFRKADIELFKMYRKIHEEKKKFGKYMKTIFHLHTPASYDYKLLLESKYDCYYKQASEEELYNFSLEKFPQLVRFDFDFENNEFIKMYSDKKELLSYLLTAKELADNNIEIALITDHNTIAGYDKLENAIKLLNRTMKQKTYTELIMGIEISCADKNHVVVIIDYKNVNMKSIYDWLDKYIMSQSDGTYLTSLEVIKYFSSLKCISYIAHFDNSDFFKDSSFLNGAYKKELFNLKELSVIGLSKKDSLSSIKSRLEEYSDRDFCYVLDNDSHSLNEIGENYFWIKGNKITFDMLSSALRDYLICVELDEPVSPTHCIEGLVVRSGEKGFLTGKNNDFIVCFSEYLNCFIGGRGTGKSTVINLIEYALQQKVKDSRMLDLFCKYSSIWILFSINQVEYMLQLYNPQKEYEDDDILKFFDDVVREYGYKYSFDHIKIKNKLINSYMKIYELKYQDEILLTRPVDNKRKYLDSVFSTAYSINELVETTNGEAINDYIFKTLFDNKIISSVKSSSLIKSTSSLKRFMEKVLKIKESRKKEVEEVIKEFNDSQTGILRIVYKQEEQGVSVFDFKSYIEKKYPVRDNFFYHNMNISTFSVVDYLEEISNILGVERFLSFFIDRAYDELERVVSIKKFLAEKNQKLIDKGIKFVEYKEINELLCKIIDDVLDMNNLYQLKNDLKTYIERIESFDLEFNINNNEQDNQKVMFKSVKELSLGQKVVAMLTFVLGYSDFSNDYTPLVIDQPEDNLDNQYIYRNLVKILKEIKSKRQIIIATHSATIVTNAKAEQVIVMESDNLHGKIKTTGYPNDPKIKKHIINYLEGGIPSFKHKYYIYKDILDLDEGI